MNYRRFVSIVFGIVLLGIVVVGGLVVYIDPYFHYHKPRPEFYYNLNSQRYQNYGILKHFDYDAIITGTSMAENFKTSEFDEMFGVKSIKVPFSGATFKEINDALKYGCMTKNNVRTVIRSLDMYSIIVDKNKMRTDLGTYPTYLYDDNLINDMKYLFNKDVFVFNVFPMLKNKVNGKHGGIKSFDDYSNWNKRFKFGRKYVLKGKKCVNETKQKFFSKKDKKIVQDNIRMNVVELAKSRPETKFYYFFPPYSVVWWANLNSNGNLKRTLDAERIAIEMILECPNIKLFSFNLVTDIVMNLDNYKDPIHYGEWINSDILRFMKNDIGLLTKENYMDYLEKERQLYLNYSYEDI